MFGEFFDTDETRVCAACLKEKPIYDFKSHGQTADGTSSRCKLCVYRKQYPKKNATHKLCAHCKAVKPVSEFTITTKAIDGYQPYCKTCRKIDTRKRYVEGGFDVVSKRYRDNIFEARAKTANEHCLKKGVQGEIDACDIYMQLEAQDFQCALCGDPLGEDFHLDHVLPKTRGGTNTPDNIQCLCAQCNLGKRNYTDEEYIAHCIKVAKRHMP